MDTAVAVITGASSGIGRATAIELARSGTHVVLGARNKKVLQEVAEECRNYGVEALVVQMDVTNEEDIRRLANAAIDRFGLFTVWINNAGVTALGSLEDVPSDIFRKVMDTNYFGCVYGSKAAVRQFKIQQAGTLINIASIFGTVPMAYESAYVASKYAVHGFTASIRQEIIAEEYPDIHVCSVLPASINTPIYRNAANYSGKYVVPLRPVYTTAHAAATILDVVEHPRPEAVIGMAGYGIRIGKAIVPTKVFDKTFAHYSEEHHFTPEPAPHTKGNLATPSKTTAISGGWAPHNPVPRVGAVLAAGALTGLTLLWLASRRRTTSVKGDCHGYA